MREVINECFNLIGETIIIKDYLVSFLPYCPEETRKGCLPQFSCFLSNREGRPVQHQIFYRGRTSPNQTWQEDEGYPKTPNLWAMKQEMVYALLVFFAKGPSPHLIKILQGIIIIYNSSSILSVSVNILHPSIAMRFFPTNNKITRCGWQPFLYLF